MEAQSNTETKKVNHTPGMAAVPNEAPKKRSKRFLFVLIGLVVVGGIFGITKYIHAIHHEETDDAQLEANISPVIPRIAGYVTKVYAQDNQMVKKGDTLLVLDSRNEKIKVDDAEAALAAAKSSLTVASASANAAQSNVSSSKANVSVLDAQIAAAKINVWRATQDYNRYANLIKDHSITEQQFEQAQAAKETAEKQLQVMMSQKNAASRQSNAAESQSSASSQQISVAKAMVQQREADLEKAQLELSYTVITAPESGRLSKIYVQPGQLVQPGQSLFSIVLDQSVWVVANFKETQLDKMKVGQKVDVQVDAYPEHDFKAKVTSFSPATGAKFALLPPDNATGNFVKVVQRVPVKIEFTDLNDQYLNKLRAGMNVEVDVHLD